MSSILNHFASHHAHTRFGCLAFPLPDFSSLRCHLAVLTLVLHLGTKRSTIKAKKIGNLNNWPSNCPGPVKYLQVLPDLKHTVSNINSAEIQYGITAVIPNHCYWLIKSTI